MKRDLKPVPAARGSGTRLRTQDQDETRGRILQAARDLFDQKGPPGLSVRAIAARACLPTMTLYSYYPSKTAIIRALWSQVFDPLIREMERVEARISEPVERLRAVAQTLVDYWLSNPDHYRIVFMIEDRREHQQDQWFIEETDVVSSYKRFGPLIAAARNDPNGQYEREGEALLCSLTGVVHMLATVSEYPWAESQTYVNMILRGFC